MPSNAKTANCTVKWSEIWDLVDTGSTNTFDLLFKVILESDVCCTCLKKAFYLENAAHRRKIVKLRLRGTSNTCMGWVSLTLQWSRNMLGPLSACLKMASNSKTASCRVKRIDIWDWRALGTFDLVVVKVSLGHLVHLSLNCPGTQ